MIVIGASALALLAVGGARVVQAAEPAAAPAPAAPADPAAAFGAREAVQQISLSPSGGKVAFIAPGQGRGTLLFVADVAGGDARQILSANGDPDRLASCHWSSETRIVCTIYMVVKTAGELVDVTRVVAVDAAGGNLKLLSRDHRVYDAYVAFSGGDVIDWLPDENGAVLMGRQYVPEERMGTHLQDNREGYGVDRVDTSSLAIKPVEPPRKEAMDYISDGRGNVRIMGSQPSTSTGYDRPTITYYYRAKGSNDWKQLGTYNSLTGEGFKPYGVDPDKDVAYGFRNVGGRLAFVSIALNGSGTESVVFQHPRVDVDRPLRIGRRDRVVGVSYATDKREAAYFDPQLQALAAALSKALPGLPLIEFVDSSTDESKLLIFAHSDTDPGRYYLFDRGTKQLAELMLKRPDLENARLATVRAVTYKAADGTDIPAYLTLPPGSTGKNLPAIVMPHGGPASRDEWGFDWLPQYFASRGYAVLQPNYRGSSGYGDAWFQDNGFKSWRIAMSDVVDAGRWLASQGIADRSKLAIFGWSYGGYAALQSSVVDPDVFKAIVAVAPVTNLAMATEEWRNFSNWTIERDWIGTGPHVREGSPAQNADRIKAPVLIFHGDMDRNVGIAESQLMDSRLRGAGKSSQLVVYPGLDHQLDDATARTDLLRKADAFLRQTLKIP
jgi:dienelactone hydrolase